VSDGLLDHWTMIPPRPPAGPGPRMEDPLAAAAPAGGRGPAVGPSVTSSPTRSQPPPRRRRRRQEAELERAQWQWPAAAAPGPAVAVTDCGRGMGRRVSRSTTSASRRRGVAACHGRWDRIGERRSCRQLGSCPRPLPGRSGL
jgi:hypothetical protein